MRILLLNQVFHPDVAATAQHAHDLARHLVERGHAVRAIASRSIYGQRGAALPRREVVDGIEVERVGRSLFGKSSLPARAVDFALFYLAAGRRAMFGPRPDVIICFTTPPFIALIGRLMRRLRGVRNVYWVMDLYPEVPIGCGVMRPRSPVARVLEAINRACLRGADRVVVLGRCMERRVLEKGIDPARVIRIGVWSDPAEVRPAATGVNPYRAQWNLGDRFVVMYSGNFGLAHDVRTMLDAAAVLDDDDGVHFAFVGGGKRKDEVERFVTARGLRHCTVAPYQPRERLDQSLGCADVHLVTMRPGLEGAIVPCKLFGIMAAAKPTIFVGPRESEIARVLLEHDAGVVVEPGDTDALVAALTALRDDREAAASMGRRARRALCDVFDRERACEAWRSMLEALVEPARSVPAGADAA